MISDWVLRSAAAASFSALAFACSSGQHEASTANIILTETPSTVADSPALRSNSPPEPAPVSDEVCSGTEPTAEPARNTSVSDACYPGAALVQTVVRDHSEALRRCYEAALSRDPQVQGSLRFTFTILGNGSVPRACASGPTDGAHALGADRAALACAVDVFRKMQFPAPGSECSAHVMYPVAFSPE
ncbi:MAG: AgmX/PglI C-terminal domain-containing protein [Polyangiaceae bacterium]